MSKIRHPEDPWGLVWGLYVGLAQSKMKWHYTWEEVEEYLKRDP